MYTGSKSLGFSVKKKFLVNNKLKMSQYETPSTVSAPSCAYATLNNYNMPSGIAVPRATVTGKYIVPNFSAPSYNTLSHGSNVPSCGGYFSIEKAYKSGQCSQSYIQSLCQ